jgi:hypothetical protein
MESHTLHPFFGLTPAIDDSFNGAIFQQCFKEGMGIFHPIWILLSLFVTAGSVSEFTKHSVSLQMLRSAFSKRPIH